MTIIMPLKQNCQYDINTVIFLENLQIRKNVPIIYKNLFHRSEKIDIILIESNNCFEILMKYKICKHKIILITLLIFPSIIFGCLRRIPEGISLASDFYRVESNQVQFLRDMTFMQDSTRIVDQQIYPKVYDLIDSAEQFLVLDIFLFIETSIDTNPEWIPTTTLLTNKLVQKKKNNPDMPIYFITDEFNIFYYSHKNKHLEQMKEAGIEVIMTNMVKLRDSHQPYSLFWRLIPRWFGNPNYQGWLPNPFTEPKEDIAIRSYLKLLNFKANHRKIILSEKEAIITSANPHSASSLHSNIGFRMEGEILQDILFSEKAIAKLSGSSIDIEFSPQPTTGPIKIQYITEQKIQKSLLSNIEQLDASDSLDIGVFYISDRKIVKALKKARERQAGIRILLDANKDAFGKEKNGIPNRQVAWELHKAGIPIRWANTHGEQFHTKMAIFTEPDSVVIIGGSANFTKRNLGNKNLEANIAIKAPRRESISQEVKQYFHSLWQHEKYSLPFEAYKETSTLKYWLYRYQEFTGASTF